jgi:excinuclease UvrABC nuclease subunit
MKSWNDSFNDLVPRLDQDLSALFSMDAVLFGEVNPPKTPGAYVIYDHNGDPGYVGEAKGSGGLRDRLLSKHLSGDDNDAIQRAYKADYPDREERRDFIRKNVSVRWVETDNANSASAIERLLIQILDPPWNRK